MAKFIKSMKGYKGTNKDMTCRGHKFKLGVWYEIEGDLSLCQRGFHFCKHPSGPYSYYPEGRVFECEAEAVLDLPPAPGADYKLVARRIRLTKEIKPDGKKNTGDQNTGYWNTGYRNTGGGNTGYRNTGYRNTGDQNTGDRNTGGGNTGYQNTGDRNTGDQNTGGWNTGDRNTGGGNATSRSSGFFNTKEPRVVCFDKQTRLTHAQFVKKYPEYDILCYKLIESAPICFKDFSRIPGITPAKLKALHKKHLAGRQEKK